MKFYDLEVGHFYMLKMSNSKDLPYPWIAEVDAIIESNVKFRDIFDFGGNHLDSDYQYHRTQFDYEIYVMKEISKEKDPEYFI